MKAVVLAAGKGVRLRPLTDNVPKAMLKVGSKPILQRVLESLKQGGVTEVLMVVGYKKDVIEDFFKEEFQGMKLTYFFQEKQLGTAHAVSLVDGFLHDNFMVLNADVIVDASVISEVVNESEFDLSDSIIFAREVTDPWRYGCLLTEKKEVRDIIEKPSPGQEPSNLINAGIYRFSQSIFEAIKKIDLSERNEFELVDAIKILIKSGKLVEFKNCTGRCIDIGSEDDLRRAQNLLRD